MERKATDLYMNPVSGSVDTWENWECESKDWEVENEGDRQKQLESLIRVDDE